MAKLAVETRYGALTSYTFPGGYDSTKLGLGPLIVQMNGSGNEGKWAGPPPIGIARPVEAAAAIPGIYPWVLQWSSTTDWVFLADNAAAAATRRIQLFEFNRTTATFTWKGYATLSFPFAGTQGTYTIRSFRMTYDTYTTGTVSVSSTAVTGSGSAWQTSRLCVGSRIGFGSTDPTQITTWYYISAIGGDTSITLTTDAGTVAGGTAYVIEDLRTVLGVTNGTTSTNGGLFMAKGLSYADFFSGGTAIAAATTTDNVKANYWLGDASTSTNTANFGMGIQSKDSWTVQYVWLGDTVANPLLFKYNLRKDLTLSSGKDTTAFVFKTGSGGAVSGTTSQANNGRLATTSTGPGNGINCFYFTTTTRVYRTVDVTTISTGSTTWLSSGDVMTEIPPGGTSTFSVTNAMNSIEYASLIDKFVIATTSASGVRLYVSRYFNDGSQLDRIFTADIKQIDQAGADGTTTPAATTLATTQSLWSEGGILYMAGVGTTALTNLVHAIPIAADWEYVSSSNARLVTPEISTPNCNKFARVYFNTVQVVGGTSSHNLGLPTEGCRVYYRTSGISDNSGSWTLLDGYGDLSGVDGATSIQFAFEFKVIGTMCIPSRLLSSTVLYEDMTTDSHYQPSVGESSLSSKQFAWRFSTAFGTTVPTLRVRLYNAVTGGLLVDDTSSSPTGTWEKSTDDGSAWGSYDTTDKGNETTYIRYTPASLGDNIKVRALLTQN